MKVCVLGAGGFIGKNLLRDTNWVGVTRGVLDLENQNDVETYFKTHTYDVVVHCGVVGGSRLKKDAGDVLWKNILMFENVVRVFKGKLIYFSSGAALCGSPPNRPLWVFVASRTSVGRSTYFSLRVWAIKLPFLYYAI